MSEIAYIPSAAAEELTRALWDLSDPNPTRGTTSLFKVVEALDHSKWLVVPLDASIPIHDSATLGGIEDLLLPWVGHGIEQSDIDRLQQLVLDSRGQRLVVYDSFPPLFKVLDESNPTGLGRTRTQLVAEGKLNEPGGMM